MNSLLSVFRFARRVLFPLLAPPRLTRWFGLLLSTSILLNPAIAQGEMTPVAKDEFSPLVKLVPFVVNGKSLVISIYARTSSDRRYGEEFAERVAKVVYESVTESTGKGLVIIGAKGEPHPIFAFRKFLELAKDGKLDPVVAARSLELSASLRRWEHALIDDKSGRRGTDERRNLDFDKIATALPLPLTGVGAKLYQLAWEEKFDDAKVEAKLGALRAGDLERRDLFRSFDWVFYLPPKGDFDQMLYETVAAVLKEDKINILKRGMVKAMLLAEKPRTGRAIEGMRQGLMFMTVVQAQTHYSEKDVSAMTGDYVKVFVPGKNAGSGSDHERAVKAVRDRLQRIEANEKGSAEPTPAESAKPEATPYPHYFDDIFYRPKSSQKEQSK